MRRFALATVVTVALVSPLSLSGQSPSPSLATGPAFEVASIKRNTSDQPVASPRPNAGSGQVVLNRISPESLVARAYPGRTLPSDIEGLPGWADTDHYDVIAKFRPGATPDELIAMWRTLLGDRMKLEAHLEPRTLRAYKLVVARADGRLGPGLTPSTLDCPPVNPQMSQAVRDIGIKVAADKRAPTAEEERTLLSQCGAAYIGIGNSIGVGAWLIGGAIDMKGMLEAIQVFGRVVDRPLVDATGLTGKYSVKLWTDRLPIAPVAGEPSVAVLPSGAPPLFSALSDQLGLKLESTTIDGRVLVVDHIERPTEN
jgi:uncharacterized protein (TIGR03435 family)